jgi:hypothetical protein
MDEFDDCGRLDVLVPLMSAGPARQKHQKGAQPLASGIYDVAGHLIDQGDLAVETMFDDPVDGLEIGRNQFANLM